MKKFNNKTSTMNKFGNTSKPLFIRKNSIENINKPNNEIISIPPSIINPQEIIETENNNTITQTTLLLPEIYQKEEQLPMIEDINKSNVKPKTNNKFADAIRLIVLKKRNGWDI